MCAAYATIRRVPGLGPAAAPRAASRAMSLRSGLGPAVSVAVAAASSRLGYLGGAAFLVCAGLFAMGQIGAQGVQGYVVN
mgnify:CR=1 FL=1